MTKTVKVRGIEYPVQRFTDVHLQSIMQMLVPTGGGHYGVGSLSVQSECAEVVLEVMLPTLPDDVITITPRGRYVWQLNQIEIPVLLMRLVRVWRIRQLAAAKARKDKAAIAEHEESLVSIDGYLAEYAGLVDEVEPQPDLELLESESDLMPTKESDLETLESEADRIARLEQELAALKMANSESEEVAV
jgi:hypothetical protein